MSRYRVRLIAMAKPIHDLKLKVMIVFGKIVCWLGVAAWLGFLGLQLHYADTRPTQEQPDQGRLFSLNSHGKVVYLTLHELTEWYHLGEAAVVLIACAAVLGFAAKRRQRRPQQT
jgi:hypothetical protein